MRTICILIIMACTLYGFSQDPPIKWKEIPMEQMKMTEYNADTSAPAIILCDYGQYYFDLNPSGRTLFLFNNRQIRIKILKPEGLKYAHIRVPYKDMTCEEFRGENSILIKGMTYNLDNKGEIKVSRLKLIRMKITDSTGCYKIAEFDMPNVKPGSIIEYSISIPTLDLVSPKTWFFQNSIPTLYSEFRMRIPSQFSYLLSPQNIENFDVYEETYFNQSLMVELGYYNWHHSLIPLYGKQIRLIKTNMEVFENPNFTNKPEDNYKSIRIHLAKATNENMDYTWEYLTHALAITTTDDYDLHDPLQRKVIDYPAAYIYYKLTDWEKFNQKLLKSDRFGLALMKHWNYEQILKDIIKDNESPEQKMIAIYDFIRKNMKWNGEYSIFVNPVFNNSLSQLYSRITKKPDNEKSLRKPFEEGFGSSSEINLTLIYLLNKAGIETDPVIISTTDHGRVDTVIPDPQQFNHVLALANINGKSYFLDATDSLRPYNILDKKDFTSQGYLVKGINYGWINVENSEPSVLSVVEQIDLDKDLNYKSNLKVSENGYFALEHRKTIQFKGIDAFKNEISDKYSSSGKIQSIDILNIENEYLPLTLNISKSSNEMGLDQIVIKADFNPVYLSSDFKDIIRQFPVEFPYPFKKSATIEINYPEGYAVKLPENQTFKTTDNNAVFNYKTELSINKVQISIELEIKTIKFPANEYNNLAQLFKEINEKINENIIIKKSIETSLFD